jgi:hypothetical protein
MANEEAKDITFIKFFTRGTNKALAAILTVT